MPIKFAPVCPIHIYEALQKQGPLCIGNYFLLLAHDVLKNPVRYHEFFFKMPNRTIIMDNSVIELGTSCTAQALFEACNIVDANVLAIPDVLQDGLATTYALNKFINDWDKLQRKGIDYPKMFIPQGVSQKDFFHCVEQGVAQHGRYFDWVGIPRNLTGRVFDSRMIPVDYLTRLSKVSGYNYKFHMMGFSDNVEDDMKVCLARKDILEGIDSAVPLRWPDLHEHFRALSEFMDQKDPEYKFPNAGKRGNWWNTCEYDETMTANIRYFRSIFNECR